MTRNRVWIALVVCFVFSFANVMFAAGPASSNSDALLDVLSTLQQKGVLTQQEYNQLKDRVTEEQAKKQAAPQLQTVAMEDESAMQHGENVVSAMSSGVGFHTGRFDVAFDGEVNGFLVHNRPWSQGLPSGCVLCQIAQDPRTSNSVRSGLLPSKLGIKISTQEHGWDVAVYFGLWPAIQSSNYTSRETGIGLDGALVYPGSSLAGGTPGIDMRQNFATLHHAKFGTLLIGRQLGLFGQEGILNDITLLGAGSTNGGNQFPSNVTFGRIGVGYIYTDFIPQITYSSPSFSGFQGSIGVMQPFDDPLAELGLTTPVNNLNAHTQPMIQGKLTYTMKPTHGVTLKAWGNFVTQKLTSTIGTGTIAPGDGLRATGVDYGFNLGYHGLTIVGYGYNGWGIGTTALMFGGEGINSGFTAPTERPSQGWYGQAAYTVNKHTFGFSYGQSNLSPANATDLAFGTVGGALIRLNASYVGQYRYAVTSWDNLVAEYTHTISKNQALEEGNDETISLGTIVFF
jgi:predicted porin